MKIKIFDNRFPFEWGNIYDVIRFDDDAYYVVDINGTEEKIHFNFCSLVGVKDNLDKRICDCEVGAENTQTYREYIQSNRPWFDKYELLGSLSTVELWEYIKDTAGDDEYFEGKVGEEKLNYVLDRCNDDQVNAILDDIQYFLYK